MSQFVPSTDSVKVWAASCRECGKTLTPTEEHYYEYRCEMCETLWHQRVQTWREGSEDDELEHMFEVRNGKT